MAYCYRAVERIPDQLCAGVVYHNEEFEIAALLCACGCGHRVTLLVPDSHQITSEDGFATIRPSIAVCDSACKSHYFITAGQVEWLDTFTDEQAALLMRGQIARHAALDRQQSSLLSHLRRAVSRMGKVISSLLWGKRR